MTSAAVRGGSKRHRSISVVDGRTEEEACASSKVCVSVDPDGMVCSVHTVGRGGVICPSEEGGRKKVFSFIKTLVYTTRVLINEDIFIDDNNNMTTQTRNT